MILITVHVSPPQVSATTESRTCTTTTLASCQKDWKVRANRGTGGGGTFFFLFSGERRSHRASSCLCEQARWSRRVCRISAAAPCSCGSSCSRCWTTRPTHTSSCGRAATWSSNSSIQRRSVIAFNLRDKYVPGWDVERMTKLTTKNNL